MALPLAERFTCCECGSCCTNLKHAFRDEREQRVLFRLAENKDIGLPLWEWEVARLREIATQRGIEVAINPLQFFHDTVSKQNVIVSFHLDAERCPFYERTCTIYGKRPATCSMFPLLGSGMFEFDFGRQPTFAKTLCNRNNGQECYDAPDKRSFATRMRDYYGSSFLSAVTNDRVNLFVAQTIKTLRDSGAAQPFIGTRDDALLLFRKGMSVTFLQFLKIQGVSHNLDDLLADGATETFLKALE